MLAAVGYGSLDELTAAALPARSLAERPRWTCRPPLSEAEALAELRRLAGRNQVLTSMIGLGYYDTVTPPVIRRNVLENPAWYTAYTPYQPEISQGRLEALLNFQTMVADLTGLPMASASLLDEATAAAEAMTTARRARPARPAGLPGRRGLPAADPRGAGHPRRAAGHRAGHRAGDPELIAAAAGRRAVRRAAAVPGAPTARSRDLGPVIEAAHAARRAGGRGRRPAGADPAHAAGRARRRHRGRHDAALRRAAGLRRPARRLHRASATACKRQLPGRLVGVSVDADGQPAYRLALQTREQHIRREKATSNICTAQVLLAVMAGMYAVYHGPEGLPAIARRVHAHAAAAGGRRCAPGLRGRGRPAFFDTVAVTLPGRRRRAVAAGRAAGLQPAPGRRRTTVAVACDETTTRAAPAGRCWRPSDSGRGSRTRWPRRRRRAARRSWPRTSEFLTHPVFHAHHTETAMLRYLRRLADRDLALDRSMIPLGSCTMKLNATAEMEPITWPEFAGLHPFAPAEQAAGYLELIGDLERLAGRDHRLRPRCRCSPTPAPRASSPGLLAIRAYHRSQRRARARRLPDPGVGARHQRGQRGDGRAARGGGQLRRRRRRRPDRPARQDGRARAASIAAHHGHLPVHPRRVRGDRSAEVCAAGARGRRPGLHGRRQPERAGRPGHAGPSSGARRLAPEPAQDLLHPARRRRPRRRPGRGAGAPGARSCPATRCWTGPRRSAASRRPGGWRPGRGRAVRLGRDPAHLLGLHPADGRRRAAPGHPGRDPDGQLRRPAAGPALPGALHRARRAGRARVHPGPAAADRADRRDRRGRGQAADRLRLPRADHVLPGGRAR